MWANGKKKGTTADQYNSAKNNQNLTLCIIMYKMKDNQWTLGYNGIHSDVNNNPSVILQEIKEGRDVDNKGSHRFSFYILNDLKMWIFFLLCYLGKSNTCLHHFISIKNSQAHRIFLFV